MKGMNTGTVLKIYRIFAIVESTYNLTQELVAFTHILSLPSSNNLLATYLTFAFYISFSILSVASSVTIWFKERREPTAQPRQKRPKFRSAVGFMAMISASCLLAGFVLTFIIPYCYIQNNVVDLLLGIFKYEANKDDKTYKTVIHLSGTLVPILIFFCNFVNVTIFANQYVQLMEPLKKLSQSIEMVSRQDDVNVDLLNILVRKKLNACAKTYRDFMASNWSISVMCYSNLQLSVAFPVYLIAMEKKITIIGSMMVSQLIFSCMFYLTSTHISHAALTYKHSILMNFTFMISKGIGKISKESVQLLIKMKTCFESVEVRLDGGGMDKLDRSLLLTLFGKVFSEAVILYQITPKSDVVM